MLVSLAKTPSPEAVKEHVVIANSKFPTHEDLETITKLIVEGKHKAAIDTIYPLSHIKKALEKSERKHGRG